MKMQKRYDWAWVQASVTQTIDIWNSGAVALAPAGRRFGVDEQAQRERAYDEALNDVEREVKLAPRTRTERSGAQERVVKSFAQFSAAALDLDGEAIRLLTGDFLPVGTRLARWARRFDADLSMTDIVQACRNAWTACGLQPLMGEPVGLTPSILGYSLLYPYSDNLLDREDLLAVDKLRFSQRFRRQLTGETLALADQREQVLAALIGLIEGQYPRARFPQVYDCLLAIHRAQEESIGQMRIDADSNGTEVLRLSCAKGGSSVLADACLAHGWLSEDESRFAFEWGVLLQLGDDLQDIQDDTRRGSVTLFSRAAAQGRPLDGLAIQLLQFSERVGTRMDRLPHGSKMLKELLKMSWRSLIIRAVADSHQFFSKPFLEEAERRSPFRFQFLRERQERLTNRQGIYTMLFDAFLADCEGAYSREYCGLPVPVVQCSENALGMTRKSTEPAQSVDLNCSGAMN